MRKRSILSQLEKKRYQRFDLNGGISEFDGKVQGEKFLDQLNFVEELFEYYDTPNHRKFRLVAIKLENMHYFGEKISMRKRRQKEEIELLLEIR